MYTNLFDGGSCFDTLLPEDIIGISRSDCNCLNQGLTEEQKARALRSVSGLYLDGQLEGGIGLSAVQHNDNCGGFFTLAEGAITGARTAFESDLIVAASKRVKSVKKGFRGWLGQTGFGRALPTTGGYQGIQVSPTALMPATMEVDRIVVAVEAMKGSNIQIESLSHINVQIYALIGGVKTVKVYEGQAKNNENNEKIFTIHFDTPKVLPLSTEGKRIEYRFLWQCPEGVAPSDNDVSCGCSQGDAYSPFVEVRGGSMESVGAVATFTDAKARGVSVLGCIYCDLRKVLCQEIKESQTIKTVIPWAILYKAGELLMENIINHPEVNRFTLMNREYMWGKRNHFTKEYELRINYIVSELNVLTTCCFSGMDTRMFVGNAIS